MSLKPYPAYKDSGVAWLGQVPDSWKVIPFYRVASERNESNKGMVEDNLLSLSYGKIIRKDMESNDGLLPESFETYQVVRAGDIVFRLTDLQNDKRSLRTALVPETGIITSAYLAAKPFGVSSIFLNYLLRSYDVTKVFYSMGGGLRQSMKFDDIKRLPILVPTSNEQHAITAFLDRETSKLDELVAEQEKLIVLLAEKRQATISYAVTKGLNPDAPMKDSGVEWLGEIPANWKVERLKFSIAAVESGTSVNATDTSAQGREFGVLKTSCVYDGDFRPEENKSVVLEEYNRVSCPVRAETLIVSRMNTPSLVGAAGYVSQNRENIFLPDRLWQVSFHEALPKFIHAWTQTQFYRLQVEMVCSGTSSSMQNLTQGQFGDFIVSLPPLLEQTAIVAFITSETGKLNALITEAGRVIDLLKERRAALISAAVTGKIDLRRPSAEIIDLDAVRRRVRGLLAVELIEKSQGRPTFGRTALQKHAYLAEVFAGVHEIGGRYIRNDYGPLDREMIADMESEAQTLCGIVTQPPTGTNRSFTYLLSRSAGTLSDELARQLGPERSAKLQRLHALLAPLNTHEAEGVATLFAVWNDFKLEKKEPTDDEIINGFLNDWHPKKPENFTAQELQLRLKWMRDHDLVPTGTGPKTETGRLFA
ncbi:MAG: hypothetical protein QM647_13760 [Asticcacaulis sp.]|uniref:hypothetical protein n=1 Tax=Asticcacaulis sp. TaxID=1872648 RepID=UPI0039E5103C